MTQAPAPTRLPLAARSPLELVDLREAAEVLHCKRSKLFAILRAGALPTVTVGRTRYVRVAALLDYLAALAPAPSLAPDPERPLDPEPGTRSPEPGA